MSSRITTWQHAERAMEELARVYAERGATAAARDAAVLAVTAQYAPMMAGQAERIQELEATLAKFAKAHKAEFKPAPIGDGRSFEHAGVTLGFRMRPLSVKIKNEEDATIWLQKEHPDFVRTNVEANREALLERLKEALLNGHQRIIDCLAWHGITIEQKDKFFIEVKESE